VLAEIQARLQALPASGIDSVGTALGMAAVSEQGAKKPVELFVVRLSERPQGKRATSGPPSQLVNDRIGVVFAVRSLNDPGGDRAGALLETVRATVRQALYGWRPASAHTPLLLGPGDLIKMERGQLWWMDQFETSHYERANPDG